MPRLVLSLDGVVLREVGLAKDRTTIGRRSHNDIVIDNLAVSGEHSVIYTSAGDVYLEDLGSTNGTYLDRAKVTGLTPVPLGVPIRIGRTSLELRP